MTDNRTGCGNVGLIGPAQDRNWWRTLVNTALNLQDPQKAGILLTS